MSVARARKKPKILLILLLFMEICGPTILWSKEVSEFFHAIRRRDKVNSLNPKNRLFHLDNDDESIQVKIYDFQLYFYESFVHDLLHFLFTSVIGINLRKNFKRFIFHYHFEFFKMMKLVKCPYEDYSFEKYAVQSKVSFKIKVLIMNYYYCLGCGTRFNQKHNLFSFNRFLWRKLHWWIRTQPCHLWMKWLPIHLLAKVHHRKLFYNNGFAYLIFVNGTVFSEGC